MDKSIEDINKKLINFWDVTIKLPEEYRKQYEAIEDKDYRILAPADKLLEEVIPLGKCKKCLDYGCGSAWAAIAMAKNGCPDVLAVDVGENIIETSNFFCELFGVKDLVKTKCVSPDWLKSVKDKTYDGLVCSNVLDVVPLETSEELLKEIARVVTDDAKIVISFNFYMTPEEAKQRGLELQEDKYLFINDVLRLVLLTDEEWTARLSKYFEIVKLDHFKWESEKREARRLFVLKKK